MGRSAHSRDAGVPLTGLLVVNPRSGSGGSSAGELVAEARTLGVEVHELSEDEDPGDVARASRAEVLGMAGGAGPLPPIPPDPLARERPLLFLPPRTREHLPPGLRPARHPPRRAEGRYRGPRP